MRARKTHLVEALDDAASRCDRPRVLAVACGHFREAQEADSVRRRAFDDIIALDQDTASLALVRDQLSQYGVNPVSASVRDLVTGRLELPKFDLIYAAGLYDYLGDAFAARLTRVLFEHLEPSG